MPIIACFEGRIAAEPTLDRTVTDLPTCEAVVLVNRRTKRGDDWVDATPTRYYLKAWRRRAEQLAQLPTGASVVVIGHVETDSWTNDQGEKRYRDQVIVDHIGLSLGNRAAGASEGQPSPSDISG